MTFMHLLCSVYIEYYNFNTVYSFLKMGINFLAPSVYVGPVKPRLIVCLSVLKSEEAKTVIEVNNIKK